MVKSFHFLATLYCITYFHLQKFPTDWVSTGSGRISFWDMANIWFEKLEEKQANYLCWLLPTVLLIFILWFRHFQHCDFVTIDKQILHKFFHQSKRDIAHLKCVTFHLFWTLWWKFNALYSINYTLGVIANFIILLFSIYGTKGKSSFIYADVQVSSLFSVKPLESTECILHW